MALAMASVISGLSISPAFADKNDGHDKGDQHGNRGHAGQRSDHDGNGHRPDHRRPNGYAQPVYVPPPVYYEPQQSPGISLFFPLDLRR